MNDRDQPLTPNDRLAQPESTPVSTPDQFPVLRRIGTRWGDNDVYGHLNNVVYYSLFDSVVNQWLIDACATDIRQLPAIGVIAETSCKFLHSTSFPDMLWIGLALGRRGTSSAVYHLAVFRDGDDGPESLACAVGRFVHVYVDRDTRRPVPIPDPVSNALNTLGAGGVTPQMALSASPPLPAAGLGAP